MELRGISAGARQVRVAIEKLELRTSSDIEPTLAKLRSNQLDALIVSATTLTWPAIQRIVAAAVSNRIPVISEPADFAEAGALVTYGVDVFAALRRSAFFVDRILKGATPKDLPIEQPTKFDLVVNLKTAKLLRIAIPASIVDRATRVIR